MNVTAEEIAQIVGGSIVGDPQARVTGVNGLPEAGPGEITFYSDPKYTHFLETTRATVVFVREDMAKIDATQIIVSEPYIAFVQMLKRYEEETLRHPSGIHPKAEIHESADVGEGAAIAAHATVEAGARIGARAVLYPGAYVGRDAEVGEDTVLYPNVVLRERCRIGARCIVHPNATVGGDGFGFAPVGGVQVKIPQVGIAVLEDEVEIGANTSIDRATAGVTRIGRGTKIDCQVQIGHNVQIGKHCVISGCSGIAGSAVIGDHVTIGGFSGIGGHFTVGDNVVIGGRSGVTSAVAEGATVSGFPAADHTKVRRYLASRLRLPEALRRLRRLEKRIDEMEER